MSQPQNIDAYLDDLAGRLLLPPGRVRRVLFEVDDHLRSRRAALVAEGLDSAAAEAQAISEFGSPAVFARGFRDRIDLPALVGSAMRPLFGITVAGLLAIGVSGVLSMALAAAFGKGFVAGDFPGVTYTASRCAELLEYVPDAADCNAAATEHHFGEIVQSRIAAGVLGLLALGGYWLLNRRPRQSSLPAILAPTIGVTAFGMAAIGLLFLSAGSAGQAGASLSGSLVAAVVAVAYGLRLLRLLQPSTA